MIELTKSHGIREIHIVPELRSTFGHLRRGSGKWVLEKARRVIEPLVQKSSDHCSRAYWNIDSRCKDPTISDEEGKKVADKVLCGNAGLGQGFVVNTTGGRWLCLVWREGGRPLCSSVGFGRAAYLPPWLSKQEPVQQSNI